MSQQMYLGGVSYICGGPYLYPSEEYSYNRQNMDEEEFTEWLKRYREDFIRHFQFEKVYHNFDIYEEDIPNGYPLKDDKKDLIPIENRFEILDIRIK